jgi:hypothetical protein
VVFEALRARSWGVGRAWPAPRRDAAALGFGVGFLVLGVAGPARIAGQSLDAGWLCPLILICLGAAGLAGVLRERLHSRARGRSA